MSYMAPCIGSSILASHVSASQWVREHPMNVPNAEQAKQPTKSRNRIIVRFVSQRLLLPHLFDLSFSFRFSKGETAENAPLYSSPLALLGPPGCS